MDTDTSQQTQSQSITPVEDSRKRKVRRIDGVEVKRVRLEDLEDQTATIDLDDELNITSASNRLHFGDYRFSDMSKTLSTSPVRTNKKKRLLDLEEEELSMYFSSSSLHPSRER